MKKFLTLTVLVIFLGFFLGWFDNFENLASLGVFLAWVALYQIIKNFEINNKNWDKIEKRFDSLEKEVYKK